MSTNDILCELHAAIISKTRERCRVEGNNKAAVEIVDAVMAYGKLLSESFANDGIIDEAEERLLCEKGSEIIRENIPSVESASVGIAWNGISLFGIGWVGLRKKFAEWFCLKFTKVSGKAQSL